MVVKLAIARKITALATVALTSLIGVNPLKANTFDETKLEQINVIAVARPFGDDNYDLLVIEQIPDKQDCWRERGSNPVIVEPLLLNFDFTGICNRATDSNGYSIRLDGQDLGLDYMLRLARRDGELVLIGTNRVNPNQEIVVGRTRGISRDFMKIQLEPGWEFSKRTYDGRVLGHFYFSGQSAVIANPDLIPPQTVSFRDVRNDIYQAEIAKAVSLGFIAGFKEDNTFRPNASLTREQLVSMAVDAMATVKEINLDQVSPTSVQPFRDVESSRWSAKKITWAQANNLIAGQPDGMFKPTDPITRAELMAVIRRVAEYLQNQQGKSPELTMTQTKFQFSDIQGHWANDLIAQMSGFCQVASPLNEQGDRFAPNQPAQRNYAAAAIVRMLDCIQPSTQVQR